MIRRAAIRAMPRPDSAEYAWDPESVCVILSDDAHLAAALEKRLAARGWRVAVHTCSAVLEGSLDTLAPPKETGVFLPVGVAVADLTCSVPRSESGDGESRPRPRPRFTEESGRKTPAAKGRVGALISIAPGPDGGPANPLGATAMSAQSAGEELLGNAREEAWLMSQFRLAKQLSPQRSAPGAQRTWFVAVTRLDGKLGLGASPKASGVVAAGVYGLVKTLRLEWPNVFCRAIDLHPGLDAAFAAERIVAELFDPDQTLGEVGHCLDGRSTVCAIEEQNA